VGEPLKRCVGCLPFGNEKMLEAFRPYLHRVRERQKSYRAGGREAVYTIFHNANAMKLSWSSIKNDRYELVVAWQDTVGVKAFKRDLYTVDLICLSILLKDNKAVELNEEMAGWESLVEKLPTYLPGCQQFAEWFSAVAYPAFKPNVTGIYSA
jgi:hypothetical protein